MRELYKKGIFRNFELCVNKEFTANIQQLPQCYNSEHCYTREKVTHLEKRCHKIPKVKCVEQKHGPNKDMHPFEVHVCKIARNAQRAVRK